MDPILAVHLIPVLVDGLIIFGIVLSLVLGKVPRRWRTGAVGLAVVVALHMAESLLEAFETGVGEMLAPVAQSAFVVALLVVALIVWREILRPQRILERASKRRAEFEGSIDEAPAIIVNLTPDGVVSHVNKFGAHLLRSASGPLVGHEFFKCCVSPDQQGSANEGFFSFVASAGQSHNVSEYRVVTLDGDRLVSWGLSAQFDDVGEVVGVILYGEDVTERRKAEAILERYQVLTDEASDIILFIREIDGRIIEANKAAQAAYGYSRDELLSLTIFDLRDPEAALDVRDQMERAAAAGIRFETVHRRSDGSTFPVEVSSQATKSIDDEVVLLSIVRDITERERADRELEENRRRLKELAKELTVSEERQRRLLAVEMHDRVSQPLAAAKLKLEVAVHRHGDAAEPEEFRESVRLMGEAISETRAITREMSPPLLYDVGLGPALEWLAAQQGQHGISCEAEYEEIESVDQDTRAFLFRAARELLTNIVKHSHADRARVALRSDEDYVVLSVSDEGDGFETSLLDGLPDENRGFGLFSIREHATLMGAQMTIESSPGEGTTVTLKVPFAQGG